MNNLAEKYPREIERILNKYPPEEKRAAVMPLIYMAQRAGGYVTREEMGEIAEIVGIPVLDTGYWFPFSPRWLPFSVSHPAGQPHPC